MQLLYFGWVRTKIGISGEKIELPYHVNDVRSLIRWLQDRGAGYSEALGEISIIRIAINQEMAELNSAITANDEVALFPPMTGG